MVRSRIVWLVTCLLAAAICAERAGAQEVALSAKLHPWGRFAPGAWKLVRVVTETLDQEGRVVNTSITETKTSLVKVEDDGVTLEVEVGIEVAGKQFDGQPQCIKQGYHGELNIAAVTARPPIAGEFTLEGRKLPCHVQQVEFAGPGSKTVADIYYTDAIAPFILKRKSLTTDAEGKTVLSETSAEVLAVDMPYRVLSEIKNSACVKTVQRHAKGTYTTLAITALSVPGGVVYHSSKELDNEGRVLRRSTLELVGYGLQPEEERTGIFGRKRGVRYRKSTLHGPAW